MSRFLFALLALLLAAGRPMPAVAAAGHDWPVAPPQVTRSFVAPTSAWSAGHRGVDLAARPGQVVRATAPGRVTFAGTVVDAAWVSIQHADGVRTSMGPLAAVGVAVGDRVARGQRVGTARGGGDHDGLHWSARRDGQYVDPVDLVLGPVVVRLVGPGGWVPTGLAPLPTRPDWDGRDRTLGFLPPADPVAGPGWLAPPNPNHVVAVAGLLTHTGSLPAPIEELGYPAEAITQLSHAGRRVEVGAEVVGPLDDQLPHGPLDTFLGVERAARLLEEQLRAQWARQPGVAVDLVGHSFGGVVVLHYLLSRHDPADPGLPPIAHVATLAAPLEGADLASAATNPLTLHPAAGALVDGAIGLAHALAGAAPGESTLDDLAVGSPLLRDLAASWARALADPHRSPLAAGTRVLTIGGSRDPVVPEHRSDLPGADHVTIPGGHTAMHGSEATLAVLHAFLADQDVPASAGGWGAWLSPGWSAVEQLLGVVV